MQKDKTDPVIDVDLEDDEDESGASVKVKRPEDRKPGDEGAPEKGTPAQGGQTPPSGSGSRPAG